MSNCQTQLRAQVLVSSPAGRQIYDLYKEYTFIGHSNDNDIQVKDEETVGKRHCVITTIGSNFYLCDLFSSKGTRLNGRAVIRLLPLKEGDVIQLGKTSIVFASASTQPALTSAASSFAQTALAH